MLEIPKIKIAKNPKSCYISWHWLTSVIAQNLALESCSQMWGEKIKDTRKSNGSNEQFEGNVDKHSRILNNLKFSMKLLAFSCLMWLYSKPGNICSKVTQKGKTCSRLLETLKTLNPRFDPFDSKVELWAPPLSIPHRSFEFQWCRLRSASSSW